MEPPRSCPGIVCTVSLLNKPCPTHSQGFDKTGLGERIANIFVAAFGKSTLGLTYGLTLAELLMSPALPSTTARAGRTGTSFSGFPWQEALPSTKACAVGPQHALPSNTAHALHHTQLGLPSTTARIVRGGCISLD